MVEQTHLNLLQLGPMDNGAWHNVKLWVFNPMSTTDGKKMLFIFIRNKKI